MDKTRDKLSELYTHISSAIGDVKKRFGFKFEYVIIVVAKRPDHPTAHATSIGASLTDPKQVFEILQHGMVDLMQGRFNTEEVKSA